MAASLTTKVVVDSGATQTAGSVEAVGNLIAQLQNTVPNFEFWVEHHRLPWFHFGDGGHLQALSRVCFQTTFGRIGIFTFEATGVPILLGADLLDEWGADLSYTQNTMTLKRMKGQPTLKVERTALGHRLLDIGELALALHSE